MAGFFSGLFGGGNERDAANANRRSLNQYTTDSMNTLDTNYNRSTGNVNTYGNNANNYYQDSYNIYGNLGRTGTSQLDSALTNSRNSLDRARSNYDSLDSLASKYGSATGLLLDSLGVNGSEGNTRATNSFQAGPGYQWQLDQGQQALERSRARRGMLSSGNTDIDTINYSQGVANQTFGDWQGRLAGFRDGELSATTNAANGRTNVDLATSNLYQNDAANRIDLGRTVAGGQSNANSGMASNQQWMAGSLNNINQQDAANRLGVYGTNLSGQTSANNLEAQGRSQGARNLLSAGMGVANMLTGGMGGGGSGFFSSMFGGGSSLFGNGTGYGTNPWSNDGQFASGSRGASSGFY